MSLSLSLSCLPSQRQELSVSGGSTKSVFPKVDTLLEDEDFQLALQYVASRKSMDLYRSMVDFLFCEIFLQFRNQCFRFYDEDGPPLREVVTDKTKLQWFEEMLLRSLNLAHKAMNERRNQRFRNWSYFRSEALKLMVA